MTGVTSDADDGERTWSERRDLLREAAYEAEYATGEREDSAEEAKRHIIVRIGIIAIGSIVLLAGLAMLVLPGQGIITVIAGLAILSRELPWAERMLAYAKKRAKVDELKAQPIWVKVAVWSFGALAMGASAWWMFIAEPRPELTALLPWNW